MMTREIVRVRACPDRTNIELWRRGLPDIGQAGKPQLPLKEG